MIEIKIKNDIVLNVAAMHIGFTYGGLIGSLTRRINEFTALQGLSYPKEKWGGKKEFKIQPSEDELNYALKPFSYNIWFCSNSCVKNDEWSDGSELVVSFLDDNFEKLVLKAFLENKFFNLDWENLAKNFCY